MVTITATATAVPEHRFTQAEIMAALGDLFALEPAQHEQLLSIFARAGVESRHGVIPLSRFAERRPLGRSMALYRQHAGELARRAAGESLARAGLGPRDVDLVVTSSCTGMIIPSLCAHLAPELGLRPDVRRLPLTELGCMGGAAALSFANDFVRGHPGATVLVIAVELPTLCGQPDDLSPANLVSSALFGDGAAAAIVTGRPAAGARILGQRSELIPGSLDAMGFRLESDGFHMILSRDVPEILAGNVRRPVLALLEAAGVPEGDLSFFALHPGGRKILNRIEQELGLDRESTQPSWDVLSRYGNLSGATVLFVLHEWFASHAPPPGARGLLGAFGPGLTAELLLLQWAAAPTS